MIPVYHIEVIGDKHHDTLSQRKRQIRHERHYETRNQAMHRSEMQICKRIGMKTTWKQELSAALKSVWSEVKQLTAFARGAVVEISDAQYQAMKS